MSTRPLAETFYLERDPSRPVRALKDRLTPPEATALEALFRGLRPKEGEVLRAGLALEVSDERGSPEVCVLSVAVLGSPGLPAGLHLTPRQAYASPNLSPHEERRLKEIFYGSEALRVLAKRLLKAPARLREWREAYLQARPGLPPLPPDLFPSDTDEKDSLLLTVAEGKGGQVYLVAGRGGKAHLEVDQRTYSDLLTGGERAARALASLFGEEEARRILEDPSRIADAVDRVAALRDLSAL